MSKQGWMWLLVGFLLLAAGVVGAEDNDYDLDEVYSIQKDGTLSLSTEDAEVILRGTDRKDVHLVVHREINVTGTFTKFEQEPFSMEVEESNGNLMIRESGGSVSISGMFISVEEIYTVEVEVPNSINIRLYGEDDAIDIQGINGKIAVKCEDGEVKIANCDSDEFDLEIEDGELVLRGGRGTLNAFAEDGEITVLAGNYNTIEADVEDGEIEIETSLADNGEYMLRADDGEITFRVTEGGGDFHVRFDDGRGRASRAFETVEEDDNYRHFRLKGGSAVVRAKVSDGDVKFEK